MPGSIWTFLGQYQTKRVRLLHLLILLLVIAQIIISNWMTGTKLETIPLTNSLYFFTWLHIFVGISLFILTPFLIALCFKERGIAYFYPWVWGDFTQIKKDLNTLRKFNLPESSPRGLAACVQGLGLGALSVVVLSGIIWFVLWLLHSPVALEARSLHKSLTILIEIYIYGHGGFAALHYIFWCRGKKHTA